MMRSIDITHICSFFDYQIWMLWLTPRYAFFISISRFYFSFFYSFGYPLSFDYLSHSLSPVFVVCHAMRAQIECDWYFCFQSELILYSWQFPIVFEHPSLFQKNEIKKTLINLIPTYIYFHFSFPNLNVLYSPPLNN